MAYVQKDMASSAVPAIEVDATAPEIETVTVEITGVGEGAAEPASALEPHLDAAPAVSATPTEQLESGLQARIREDDAAFHHAYLRGLALSWGNLWIALGVMGASAAGLSMTMADALVGLGGGAVLGIGVYLFIASLNGLRLDFEHERKVAQIHRTARLGAERVRIDDPALVRGALGDVLSEWMHGALLLRRLRETSFWYRVAVIAEIGLALAAIGVLALLSPLAAGATALLAGAALGLTAYHGWREIRAGRERGLACALGEELDPTEALADRVVLLLEEVRDLRRRGERR